MSSSRRLLVVGLLTVPLVAQCAGFSDEECYKQQVSDTHVAAVSIVFDTIQSAYGRTLQLKGLLWDSDGALLPEFLLDPQSGAVGWTNSRQISWSVQSVSGPHVPGLVSLAPISPNGHRAMVKIQLGFAPVSSTYRIVARTNGFADTMVLRLVPRDSQLLTDGIVAMSAQGSLPSVAVIDWEVEADGSECIRRDAWLAFSRIALLGGLLPVGSDCKGDYAIFSEGRRAVHGTRASEPILDGIILGIPPWPGTSAATIGLLPVPPEADTIGIVAWLPRSSLKGWQGFFQVLREYFAAQNELRLAREIFRRERTGLTFRLYDVAWYDPEILANVSFAVVDPCPGVRNAFQTGNPSPMAVGIQAMHVVHSIHVREADQVKMGLACPSLDGAMTLAIVFTDTRVPSTLAHELGHLLTSSSHFNDFSAGTPLYPLVPSCDVPDEDSVVPEHNLMASFFGGHYAASRHHLTIGQSFRMNFWSNSFIFKARSYPHFPSPAWFVDVRNHESEKCNFLDANEDCPHRQFDPGWMP